MIKLNEKKDMKFLELSVVVRASCIHDINGLLPLLVNDFLLKQEKANIGSWASNKANFTWELTDLADRKY